MKPQLTAFTAVGIFALLSLSHPHLTATVIVSTPALTLYF